MNVNILILRTSIAVKENVFHSIVIKQKIVKVILLVSSTRTIKYVAMDFVSMILFVLILNVARSHNVLHLKNIVAMEFALIKIATL